MPTSPPDLPNPSGNRRLSLLQRLTFLFRTYEIPADCLALRGPFRREDRRCFTLPLPPEWASDDGDTSAITLYEDGLPLGPAHVSHDDIRTLGRGRYSHWGDALYFSASDDTDPNGNGRVYSVQPPAGWSGTLPRSPWVAPAPDELLASPVMPAADAATSDTSTDAAADQADATRRDAMASRAKADAAGLPSLGWRILELHRDALRHGDGHAVLCDVPAAWPSDADNLSTLLLLEDDVPLQHPHAMHADIATLGGGRYSHWGSSVLFSSSDGTDPATNGRRYAAAWADALLFSHAPRKPQPDSGHCHVLSGLPRHWVSDDAGSSRLMLLEDGQPLGPAHAPHTEIRDAGCGRLSHWQGQLWFSTSDNSDPATNGRTYVVQPLD